MSAPKMKMMVKFNLSVCVLLFFISLSQDCSCFNSKKTLSQLQDLGKLSFEKTSHELAKHHKKQKIEELPKSISGCAVSLNSMFKYEFEVFTVPDMPVHKKQKIEWSQIFARVWINYHRGSCAFEKLENYRMKHQESECFE